MQVVRDNIFDRKPDHNGATVIHARDHGNRSD